MVMGSAWRKNNLRELRHSLGRFLAILAIIALGVGFFGGLKAAKPAMLRTGGNYIEKTKLFDFRLITTLGLTQEDVDYFAGLSGVETAEGAVTVDAVTEMDGTERTVKLLSLPEGVSVPELTAGRLPENADECLLDAHRFGEDALTDILRLWSKARYKPDFISMYNFPYSSEFFSGKRTQSLDRNFFREHIARVRELLSAEGFGEKPLHVTEWSFSVSNRNMLNDHCMNGAYVMKNAIDCYDLCDLMGYFVGSDLYSNYYDTNQLLNGGSGLLSKDGIPKPSCYAMEFMNRLGKNVLQKGEHYLITSNSGQSFRIVCHNLKDLNYQYSRKYEDEITLETCDRMFTDMKRQHIHFELPIKNSRDYFVRISTVNRRFGSIQDEWADMMAPKEMRLEDLRYLSRITTPRMYINKCEEKNGRIIIDVDLEPNEITFMHVVRKY